METLSGRHKDVIRRQVDTMLGRNRAWRALGTGERDRIARDTAAIVESLASDRLGRRALSEAKGAGDVWSGSLADAPVDPFAGSTAPPPAAPAPGGAAPERPWRPDDRFEAEAINAGVRAAGNMLREVDFPAFVSNLVQGTFQAIVDASIQQMKAYGELVQSVAMSLSQFRDANVSPAQGGDALVQRYPHLFEIDNDAEGGPRVRAREDADVASLPDFQREFGLAEPVEDLEPETIDTRLIPAMRDEVALGRQKLLATTLLMGINRIIVTDGRINAKVTFDFKASDHLSRTGVVNNVEDRLARRLSRTVAFSDRVLKGEMEEHAQVLVSSTQGASTGDIDAKATLKGEVSINFRSETFPLERMVNTDQMTQLTAVQGAGRAAPPGPPPAAVTAPAAAPAATTQSPAAARA